MPKQIETCNTCVNHFECNARFQSAALAIKATMEEFHEVTDSVVSGFPSSDGLNLDFIYHPLQDSIVETQLHTDERIREIEGQLISDQLSDGCSYYQPDFWNQLRPLMDQEQ